MLLWLWPWQLTTVTVTGVTVTILYGLFQSKCVWVDCELLIANTKKKEKFGTQIKLCIVVVLVRTFGIFGYFVKSSGAIFKKNKNDELRLQRARESIFLTSIIIQCYGFLVVY